MVSEQIRSIKQELADITALMANTKAVITEATDPFPWEVPLDGLRVRRLRLTEELVAKLEVEVAMRGRAMELLQGDIWNAKAMPYMPPNPLSVDRAMNNNINIDRAMTQAREESQCKS